MTNTPENTNENNATNVDVLGEKGRYLTQSYDKSPYTHRQSQKAMRQHKHATQNVDLTVIADGLRTVSWSNGSLPTGVVKHIRCFIVII